VAFPRGAPSITVYRGSVAARSLHVDAMVVLVSSLGTLGVLVPHAPVENAAVASILQEDQSALVISRVAFGSGCDPR
jgi:hypothetical protein